MKAYVDTDRCVWCGQCSETCPDVFTTHDTVTTARADHIPVELEDDCLEAMRHCPLEAIAIV